MTNIRRTLFIGLLITLCVTQVDVVRASSSVAGNDQAVLIQSIETRQNARRIQLKKERSLPKKALTKQQKIDQRKKKIKQFEDMLRKLDTAKITLQKQLERKKKIR